MGKTIRDGHVRIKNLPNMNTFCDWLSETIVISVYDSFFRNYISIVLWSFIVLSSESQRLFIKVRGDPMSLLKLYLIQRSCICEYELMYFVVHLG